MNVLRYGNRVANIAVLASVCFGCGDADQDLQLVQQSNSLRFVNVSPPPQRNGDAQRVSCRNDG